MLRFAANGDTATYSSCLRGIFDIYGPIVPLRGLAEAHDGQRCTLRRSILSR